MATERYAHILDDNRRMNAERFQQQFYSGPVNEEPTKQPDPPQQSDAGGKQALLFRLLAESPEMIAMIKSLASCDDNKNTTEHLRKADCFYRCHTVKYVLR